MDLGLAQLIWLAGLLVFVLIGLLLLAMALARLRGGDLAGVARLIGTRSAQEEVEDEIQALKQRQTEAERG